ncbi:hypothetical protein D3C80_1589000 [compost metagenome]
MQLGIVPEDDGVARQLYAQHLVEEGLHVGLELVRLGLAGGQENLVAAGGDRVDQRLTGKVERRADLAAFQDHAGAHVPGAVPIELVVETAIAERLDKRLDLFLAQLVTRGCLLWPLVALGDVRIEVCLGATNLVALNPGLSLQLAMQKVNFLEVGS